MTAPFDYVLALSRRTDMLAPNSTMVYDGKVTKLVVLGDALRALRNKSLTDLQSITLNLRDTHHEYPALALVFLVSRSGSVVVTVQSEVVLQGTTLYSAAKGLVALKVAGQVGKFFVEVLKILERAEGAPRGPEQPKLL